MGGRTALERWHAPCSDFEERVVTMFEDRRDAGRRLARKLGTYGGSDCVIVGLPRGGIVVADEIATALGASLDVVVVRKLRAPDDPERAIGALVAGAPPDVALDEGAIESLEVSPDYVLEEITAQLAEARLREALLRARQPAGEPRGSHGDRRR